MANISDYKLHVIEGHEQSIPKYGLSRDIRDFDLDSLVRMYGENEVIAYLRTLRDSRVRSG